MSHGNQKGSAFERDLCRLFSQWLSGGTRDDLFWRTAGSGSRATNRVAAGQDLTKFQHGDMTFIDPAGRPLVELFSFEFKSYAGIDVFGILHSTCPEKSLLSFWGKCVRDAEVSERVPFMVTKVNRGQPIAWMPMGLLTMFTALGMSIAVDRGIQFWFPAGVDLVTKRTYKRRKKGEVKKTSGKGQPRLEHYVFPSPQFVIGVDLAIVLKCLRDPAELLRGLQVSSLPVPRRDSNGSA